MKDNVYLRDILSQPAALRTMLARLDLEALRPYTQALKNGEYDRIILTGMGASGYAAYPAWVYLLQAGIPAIWVDCAELIHYARPSMTRRSLIWIISQSGRSAEVLRLLDWLSHAPPAAAIALTNDPASPLAKAADLTLFIDAQVEETVSTRTYMNSLAITQLAALALCGTNLTPHLEALERVIAGIGSYLATWEVHLRLMESLVGVPQHLAILGRGPSMAAALTGALIIGEAARYPALALNAAQFRHGPLEMVNEMLTVLVFAGQEETAALNMRLLQELISYGASALWLSPQPEAGLPALSMPQASGIGLPLAEIVPLQLLSVAMATQAGIVPGKFLHTGKVTLTE